MRKQSPRGTLKNGYAEKFLKISHHTGSTVIKLVNICYILMKEDFSP